mgnify:CR=1 FL=1
MQVIKNISDYLVFESESILKALEKINSNKKRIIFIVSEGGKLIGSLSDGDLRRRITSGLELNLNSEIASVMNKDFKHANINDQTDVILKKFSNSIDSVPLIDDYGRFVALALNKKDGFTVGKKTISENSSTFIIAEIGNNHNGSIELAKQLVDLAQESGADCVKFQMRDMKSLYKYGKKNDDSADLGTQYTLDLLSRFQLSDNELIEVFDYCKTKSLTPLCTPWDSESLKKLEAYGMEFYKVASADLTNHKFLGELIETRKPLICSTGMSTESEIIKTVNFLRSNGATFCLLHCNSTYPSPFKDINLNYLSRLSEISDSFVGYSGHERGNFIPIAAVAKGAKIIEKHFTIDRTLEGNDHKVSLLPAEFKEMVENIRSLEDSLGRNETRVISQGELLNRESLSKSLIASVNIEEGQMIENQMIDIKSPGQGLQPIYINELVGRFAKRNLKPGDYFYESDLEDKKIDARNYNFSRPFGIPVRYHDYDALSKKSNLDFVEFHLSYLDLNIDLKDFFKKKQDINFAVHSPELFSGDHIMDLSSSDGEYREHSISELQRVCKITRKLKEYFPKTAKPVVVINAGGFSEDNFLDKSQKSKMYDKVAESLSSIDSSGVEIIIQTMPPFPWHFGGQRFHNLFLDPDDIVNFCDSHNCRICFDVSHSMMACNYYKWDIFEFTKKVAPYIAHMHIVDALGIDGEGIQIGKGDVKFKGLAKVLEENAPKAMFIPEVWQGHKNSGEGFWHALDFLEDYF